MRAGGIRLTDPVPIRAVTPERVLRRNIRLAAFLDILALLGCTEGQINYAPGSPDNSGKVPEHGGGDGGGGSGSM